MKAEDTPLDIYLRAHIIPMRGRDNEQKSGKRKKKRPARAELALILGASHKEDFSQSLTLLSYRYCRRKGDVWSTVKEGLVSPAGGKNVESIEEFLKEVFWPAVRAGAMIVGFDLADILASLFVHVNWKPRNGPGWTGYTKKFKKGGKWVGSGHYPAISIRPRDGRYPGINSGNCMFKFPDGQYFCLRKTAYALSGGHFSLHGACEHFGVPFVTTPGPDGVRQAVAASAGLFGKLFAESEKYGLDPGKAASPASISKFCLSTTGIKKQFNDLFSPGSLAATWETYFGGDFSINIKNIEVPCVPLDFTSNFALIFVLQGLQSLLIAEGVEEVDALDEVRAMFSKPISPGDVLDRKFWKLLNGRALINPNGLPFPVRAKFNGSDMALSVGPLHDTNGPQWLDFADLASASLRSGKAIDPNQIIEAIKFVPVGVQAGLRPAKLYDGLAIDLRRQDIAKVLVEMRVRAKEAGNEVLAGSLKGILVTMFYGIFSEVNVERLKNGDKTEVWCHTSRGKGRSPATAIERPGDWSFPLLASLVTAGSRLLIALALRMLSDRGGVSLMQYVDAIYPVATKAGGFIPCPGGPHRMSKSGGAGKPAVKALSWAELEEVRQQINELNPFDREIVPEILRLDKPNFGPGGTRREVVGLTFSATHYCLIDKENDRIIKVSEHTLGNYVPPMPDWDGDADCWKWSLEAWGVMRAWIAGRDVPEPDWLNLTAVRKRRITNLSELDSFSGMNKKLPRERRIRPWSTYLEASQKFSGPGAPTPVAPCGSDAPRWNKWWDKKGGLLYVAPPRPRDADEEWYSGGIELETYEDVLNHYMGHPEEKALGPNGKICTWRTEGLLKPRTVIVSKRVPTGKEFDRKLDGPDTALGDEAVVYGPRVAVHGSRSRKRVRHNPKLVASLRSELNSHSRVRVAAVSGVSVMSVKTFCLGRYVNSRTLEKLKAAANLLKASPLANSISTTEAVCA